MMNEGTARNVGSFVAIGRGAVCRERGLRKRMVLVTAVSIHNTKPLEEYFAESFIMS